MQTSKLTSVHFLQRLVGEEAEAGVGNHAQDGGGEASVERLQALLSRYPHKHVQNVTVPNTEGAHRSVKTLFLLKLNSTVSAM